MNPLSGLPIIRTFIAPNCETARIAGLLRKWDVPIASTLEELQSVRKDMGEPNV